MRGPSLRVTSEIRLKRWKCQKTKDKELAGLRTRLVCTSDKPGVSITLTIQTNDSQERDNPLLSLRIGRILSRC
jgi:hypothetical protein